MIFIDTGAFLARYVEKDQFHPLASAFWHDLRTKQQRLATSNFVIDELATLLCRRAGHQFTAQRLKNLYASSTLEILRPDREDELHALKWLTKFADQDVSFTDCTSFVLMRSRRIKRVFSFDRHFDAAGFQRMPMTF